MGFMKSTTVNSAKIILPPHCCVPSHCKKSDIEMVTVNLWKFRTKAMRKVPPHGDKMFLIANYHSGLFGRAQHI